MFLMKLAEKYSNMNNFISKYNKCINAERFKGKMLVNAIAWIADKTETDYYGWDYVVCQTYVLYLIRSLVLIWYLSMARGLSGITFQI
jgi:hypothetical protein